MCLPSGHYQELELELIQNHMTQKPVLRVEVTASLPGVSILANNVRRTAAGLPVPLKEAGFRQVRCSKEQRHLRLSLLHVG